MELNVLFVQRRNGSEFTNTVFAETSKNITAAINEDGVNIL